MRGTAVQGNKSRVLEASWPTYALDSLQAIWAAQRMVEEGMVHEIWAAEYMAQFEGLGGRWRTLHEDTARRMQRAAVAPPLEYPMGGTATDARAVTILSPSTTVLPAAMASKPPPASGRMRPADPVFHHGLRPCDAYVVQSHKPPPMRTPQRCAPLTPIKIEDYTDDEDDLMYYCENCDPCPVCGSPPVAETQQPQPPPVAAPTTAQAAPHTARPLAFQTVPLSLPVTIFIVESWITGDWRHLVLPYLIGIALCYT
ncbi:hypothetical protein C8R47DRAFT_1229891 [Mycena vitilis]|nr:hypothetical protein C8R47DRAFT_1229891 [Mycena vitilis]